MDQEVSFVGRLDWALAEGAVGEIFSLASAVDIVFLPMCRFPKGVLLVSPVMKVKRVLLFRVDMHGYHVGLEVLVSSCGRRPNRTEAGREYGRWWTIRGVV